MIGYGWRQGPPAPDRNPKPVWLWTSTVNATDGRHLASAGEVGPTTAGGAARRRP